MTEDQEVESPGGEDESWPREPGEQRSARGVTHEIAGLEPRRIFYNLDEMFEYLNRERPVAEDKPGSPRE